MAYNGWFEFGGVELANISRTSQLAEALGVSAVWVSSSDVEWIQTELAGVDYHDITQAPWYDPVVVASSEFAGFLPLDVDSSLDSSSLQSSPVEYIDDGGNVGRPRNAVLDIVWSGALVATTERGAEFGRRWLTSLLRRASNKNGPTRCSGNDLRYFRTGMADDPTFAHRNSVALTRGISVTRKKSDSCSAVWMVTFTMSAGDPFEYTEPLAIVTDLDASAPVEDITIVWCPEYDYSPIYDPNYPALIAPPTPQNATPLGWTLSGGENLKRFWGIAPATLPRDTEFVPLVALTSGATEARMVRVVIATADADPTDQCGFLWEAVVSYIPPGVTMYIDGEQKACYVWDGVSPAVRRCDSLVYTSRLTPVQWRTFTAGNGLMVALDRAPVLGAVDNVACTVSLIEKTD